MSKGFKYKYDCKHFRGYKPCDAKQMCQGCTAYKPWSMKIVVLKLGALGDVLRTTPVLPAFRVKYPGAHITWVTRRNAKELLETNASINRLLFVDDPDNGTILRLLHEEFDELHSYDKDDAAISLASLIKAKRKFGFGMNIEGQMAPLTPSAEYSFDLGLSDDLKFFKNKKTYQELTFETSELPIEGTIQPYTLNLKDVDREPARFLKKRVPRKGGPVIGLNTGSGKVFRTKQWDEDAFYELAKLLKKDLGAQVLLLGGVDEMERNERLVKKLKNGVIFPGAGFSIRQFAGILEICDAIVTGDTLAMHLALAVGTPPVVLFGSTCEQEVHLYGLGEKIVSRPACAPCYKDQCDQKDNMKCMNDIKPRRVLDVIKRLVTKRGIEAA